MSTHRIHSLYLPRTLLVPICVVLSLLAFPLIAHAGPSEPKPPVLELYTLDDRFFSLREYLTDSAAQNITIAFFSTTCAPCVEKLPRLAAIHREHHARGRRVVLVALPDDPDDLKASRARLKEFFATRPVPFPLLYDLYLVVAQRFGVATRDKSVTLPHIVELTRTPAGTWTQASHAGAASTAFLDQLDRNAEPNSPALAPPATTAPPNPSRTSPTGR